MNHVSVLAEVFIAQVEIVVVAVLQFVITADLRRAVGLLVEEGRHFDERGTGDGARSEKRMLLASFTVYSDSGWEEVVLVKVASFGIPVAAVGGIVHPLPADFVAHAEVY